MTYNNNDDLADDYGFQKETFYSRDKGSKQNQEKTDNYGFLQA